jgi:lactoylglutathione lyase
LLTVSSIGHVAIRVVEIGRTLDFYVNKLGFQEMMRMDREGKLWIVYLRITDGQFLEIFPGGSGDVAPGAEVIGYNHLCLIVSDIRQAEREINAAGITITREVLKHPADNNWQFWIADPDGHRIEIMSLGEDSKQLAAIARLKAMK